MTAFATIDSARIHNQVLSGVDFALHRKLACSLLWRCWCCWRHRWRCQELVEDDLFDACGREQALGTQRGLCSVHTDEDECWQGVYLQLSCQVLVVISVQLVDDHFVPELLGHLQ